MRKVTIAVLAVSALTLFMVGSALADQTNGTGKTHLGFTVGYVAKADLSGSFEYQPTINGTDLNIHCGQTDGLPDYTRYTQTFTNNGFPKSIFNSTYCWDQSGTRYYVHVEAVDRGEPGVASGDSLCITVKLYPGKTSPWTFKDCGTITDGNVQIHPDTQDTIVDDGTAP
jgi:hypothetical protein